MSSSGRLTTHVLDVARGRPAEGVEITLHALGAGAPELVAQTRTNADGRTDAALVEAGALRAGTYELTFTVGAYLATATDAAPGGVPFLDVVPVRFGVADPDRDHHVPLLLTPWSYSVYRGS